MSLFSRLFPHAFIAILAVIFAIYFRLYEVFLVEEITDEGIVSLRGRSEQEIVEYLLKKKHKVVATPCSPTNSCFVVVDSYHFEDEALVVRRNLLHRGNSAYSLTGVELQPPPKITWRSADTRKWRVNKLVVDARYAKVMVAAGFFMESLDFDEGKHQEVLMAGLGGGVISNFFSQIDYLNISTIAVEIDPFIVNIAKQWFDNEETANLQIIRGDFIPFLGELQQETKRYDAIIVDVCHSDTRELICPIEEVRNEEVIRKLQAILSETGTLILNICAISNHEQNEEALLKEFDPFFNTCFLLKYLPNRRMLICSNRPNWSWEDNKERFLSNLEKVDDIFDFRLTSFFQ
ncbi:unnamed protein product [Caenorhabditis auriculariae]|uniref:Methyltransferase-like protein 13 n=1 Tax=Caenorhabditis auriculariae TaxID=2777116 RepID=A0A8S1H6Z5_9PELO|nr:unnamed protein product [Caenorhabditis auriculariae]